MSFAKQALFLDLATGKAETKALDEQLLKDYIGGVGLGVKLWLDHSKKCVDSFGADNPIVFVTGALTGTISPLGGNGYAVVSKSPVTELVCAAKTHGFFGAELKQAGYDAIVITGKSEKLVYVWIDDDSVQLVDASRLAGKSPQETVEAIKDEQGDCYVRVCAVGAAAEKLVRFACIINDDQRVAGRGGMGAVLGSKNVKAVAVRGTKDVNVAKYKVFTEFVRNIFERMKEPQARNYRHLGSSDSLVALNRLAALPSRNFSQATFEKIKNVTGESLKAYVQKVVGCSTCGLRFDCLSNVPDGKYAGSTANLKFESLWAVGPLCGVDRLDAIIEAIRLCDNYGLDVISAGASVAFVMDLYESKIITDKETEGLNLDFGNHEALLEVIKRIGVREGWLGEVLSDGTKLAAEKIGKGSNKYANHVKGLELQGYDLRSLKTAALGATVSSCGERSGVYACLFDIEGKVDRLKIRKGQGKLVAETEDLYNVVDSLMLCKYSNRVIDGFKDMAEYYRLATGIKVTEKDLMKAGERIKNLVRAINLREGKGTRIDDVLPWKIMNVPIPDEGVAKGSVVTKTEIDLGLDDYYSVRSWDKNGVPTVKKLEELGLGELVKFVENQK
ncbi:MAG: aldehyde ferredoxin oxidoreductase family protein [Candidatus Bathyarchaeota archaeon]|nr:MAG: aldehyde ferredoxin oxidoreductase family protein [Candidatus Bathyarchaeota archaeon]